MIRTARTTALALAACSALAAPVAAEFRFHAAFGDHMVLQRGMPTRVAGFADQENATVEVAIAGRTATATVAKGRWTADLPALEAGGPFELTAISDGKKLVLKDVLAGDVWVCSGQSNMEWSMRNTDRVKEDLPTSAHDKIRLFHVDKNVQERPLAEPKSAQRWQPCGPRTVEHFSAVGYYFGRKLHQDAGVPIGLVEADWGGTIAEAWTSPEALAADDRLKPLVRAGALQPGNPNQGSVLYNGMLAPLAPLSVRGAIWYQGESNAGRAWQYRTLFRAMIQDWRRLFAEPDMPFYFVQLAPWDPSRKPLNRPESTAWPELRESQRETALTLEHTGMAVITDTVDPKDMQDIHPRNKKTVGERLAALALADVYGKTGESRGPEFAEAELHGPKASLTFRHTGSGLLVKGPKLLGFALAGPDDKFHAADAVLEGERVVVSCPQVKEAKAVRFGWADFPVGNLFNKEGFPAGPFRTDNAKWITDQPYVAPKPPAPKKTNPKKALPEVKAPAKKAA